MRVFCGSRRLLHLVSSKSVVDMVKSSTQSSQRAHQNRIVRRDGLVGARVAARHVDVEWKVF